MPLPAGQAQALLADERVHARRQRVREVRLRHIQGFVQGFLGPVRRPEEHIVADGIGEQRGVLERDAHHAPELVDVELAQVNAVDGDGAVRDVVQPRDQLDQRALTAPRNTDQRHGFARPDLQVDVFEDGLVRRVLERERGVGEGEGALELRGLLRGRGTGDGVDRIHHLEVTVDGGFGSQRHGQQHAGEFHRRRNDSGGGEEGHQGADAQLPAGAEHHAHHEPRAERKFRQQGDHHGEGCLVAGLGDLGLAELLGLLVEVLQRLAAAAEGLQDADAMDGFLHGGGQIPGLVLAAPRHLAEAGPEAEPVGHDGYRCGQENQGQLPAHGEHDHNADDHRERGDHQHDGAECHPAAQEVQVSHGAGEQLSGTPAVVEGHGEVLQVPVQ